MSLNYKHNPEKWSLAAFPQYVHHRLLWKKNNIATLQRSRGGVGVGLCFCYLNDFAIYREQNLTIYMLRVGKGYKNKIDLTSSKSDLLHIFARRYSL